MTGQVNNKMDMLRLKPSQKKSAARVFARSFFDYPMMTFNWPDPDRRARYFEWYWGCALNYGFRYGEIYTTPDIAGISIWLPPGQTHITTWRYLRSGYLPLPFAMGTRQFFTRAMKNDDFVLKIHSQTMPGPHWYLWAIAVDPDQQNRGIGTRLVQPGLARAEAQHLPCYLETHDSQNIPFYQKHGFEMVRTELVPGTDLRFWCFVRPPD